MTFKKMLFALLGLAGMSAMAADPALAATRTWQLQTRLATAGGTLKVQRSDTPLQTVVGTIVQRSYTTHQPVAVQVNALAGYTISGITRNGITTYPGGTTYLVPDVNDLSRLTNTLAVTFVKPTQQLSITTTAGPGGSISPSTFVPYGGKVAVVVSPTTTAGVVRTITVSPAGGSTVAFTDNYGNPLSLPYAGTMKVILAGVTSATTVSATFTTVTVDAGAEQATVPGALVTLHGQSSGGDATAWRQESGPATVLSGSGLSPTFTPTVAGTYVFRLDAYFGGKLMAYDTTQVRVYNSITDAMRSSCQGCHDGSGQNNYVVFSNWSSSEHKNSYITCITCHTDQNHAVVTHKSVDASTFNILISTAGTVGTSYCATCHREGGTAKAYTPLTGSHATKKCSDCHSNVHNPAPISCSTVACHPDSHDPASNCKDCHTNGHDQSNLMPGRHKDGVLGTSSQYVAYNLACADCHAGGNSRAYESIMDDFALSGHGDVNSKAWVNTIENDWPNMSGCRRCHSYGGYIDDVGQTSTPFAIGQVGGVLACSACHADLTQVDSVYGNTARREVNAYLATWTRNNVTATVNFPDVGDSNLCIPCHSGRYAGPNITMTDTTTAHYLPAAAVVFGGIPGLVRITANTAGGAPAVGSRYSGGGYEFAGQSYVDYVGSHRGIGAYDGGPCVNCHMLGVGHSWEILDRDQSGTITQIKNGLCSSCHPSMSPTFMNTKEAEFKALLGQLDAALQLKDIFLAADGNFYQAAYVQGGSNTLVNFASVVANPLFNNLNQRDLQGAAYNLWLFKFRSADPAGWIHNPAYAKKLVNHSINYLNDGLIN